MRTGGWQRILELILIASIPPMLLFGNVYLLLSPVFISHEYRLPDFPAASGYEFSDRLQAAGKIVAYLKAQKKAGEMSDLSPREISHLADVKMLFSRVFLIQKTATGLVLLLFLILAAGKKSRRRLPRIASYGGLLTIFLLILIGGLAVFDFYWFFTQFHRLFFAGNSWMFSANATLIKLFPEKFWSDATMTLVLLTIAEALALASCRFIKIKN